MYRAIIGRLVGYDVTPSVLRGSLTDHLFGRLPKPPGVWGEPQRHVGPTDEGTLIPLPITSDSASCGSEWSLEFIPRRCCEGVRPASLPQTVDRPEASTRARLTLGAPFAQRRAAQRRIADDSGLRCSVIRLRTRHAKLASTGGLATGAAKPGRSDGAIMAQTGHRPVATVRPRFHRTIMSLWDAEMPAGLNSLPTDGTVRSHAPTPLAGVAQGLLLRAPQRQLGCQLLPFPLPNDDAAEVVPV